MRLVSIFEAARLKGSIYIIDVDTTGSICFIMSLAEEGHRKGTRTRSRSYFLPLFSELLSDEEEGSSSIYPNGQPGPTADGFNGLLCLSRVHLLFHRDLHFRNTVVHRRAYICKLWPTFTQVYTALSWQTFSLLFDNLRKLFSNSLTSCVNFQVFGKELNCFPCFPTSGVNLFSKNTANV